MTVREIPDETLVALADGELPAAEAATLREKIAADPSLRERFALYVETRALLESETASAARSDDCAGLDRLTASIRAADAAPSSKTADRRDFTVIDGNAAAGPSTRSSARPAPRFRVAMPALAASVALVLGGVLGFAVGRGGGAPTGGVVALAGSPAAAASVAAALERSPSGESLDWSDPASKREGTIAVIATHRLKDSTLCREYEVRVDGLDSVAMGLGCREAKGAWRTEILARSAAAGADYAAASGASAVASALEALGEEATLSSSEEKRLIAAGWGAQAQ